MGKIGQNVANRFPPQQHFFKKKLGCEGAITGDGLRKFVTRFGVIISIPLVEIHLQIFAAILMSHFFSAA